MSSADFRSLAERQSPNQADSLLRAAITAFVSLTRPTRADAGRLFDLAEPLLPLVSLPAQRFAAAALSDSAAAPMALVRLMASLPVSVSAPLLVRSPLLNEIDLIALIGRHGLAHARAIARRPELGPRLATLLASLPDDGIAARFAPDVADPLAAARDRLRAIGREMAEPVAPIWKSLRDTALSGQPALFQTALADALEIGFAAAGRVGESEIVLIAGLRTLALPGEQAFLLVNALFPGRLVDAAFIRQFLADYDALDLQACDKLIGEIVEDGATPAPTRVDADNSDRHALRRLRAS